MMKLLFCLAFILAALIPLGAHATTPASHAGHTFQSVTVPMQLQLHRPYVTVTLTGPDGYSVKACAYVDTGSEPLILSANLAKQLGLKPTGKTRHGVAPTKTPEVHVGNMLLTGAPSRTLITENKPAVFGHTNAEVVLPGSLLQPYTVVFDYPAHTFTIANPVDLQPGGTAVKTYIGTSGLPVVWVSVSGNPGFLLDTGGQTSMISTARIDAWIQQHPHWRHLKGAYGPADMLLGNLPAASGLTKTLHMLSVGSMQWGPFHLTDVNAVSRPAGIYEKHMSQATGKPVIGSIAGDVLRNFRVTIDYPAGKVYLKRAAAKRQEHLDMVGIMLEPASDGSYEVVKKLANQPHIQVGDQLLKVDGHSVTHAVFPDVVRWLGGQPGQQHTLTVKRGGKTMTIKATVHTIL